MAKKEEKRLAEIQNMELAEQVGAQTKNLRRVFREVVRKTKAKDKRLGGPEILRVMRLLGMNPTEEEIHRMLYTHDTDGSNRLSEDQYIFAMLSTMKVRDSREEIEKIFKMFDKDGNGFIDPSELMTMFQFACGPNTGIDMSDITDIMQELDIDGDSLLDYKEFVNIFAPSNKTEDTEDTEETKQVEPKKPVYFDV